MLGLLVVKCFVTVLPTEQCWYRHSTVVLLLSYDRWQNHQHAAALPNSIDGSANGSKLADRLCVCNQWKIYLDRSEGQRHEFDSRECKFVLSSV